MFQNPFLPYCPIKRCLSPNFSTFKEPRNRFQGIKSTSLCSLAESIPVPEFIDPVFTKTSPKRSFSLYRKRAYWLVFAKAGSIISGTGLLKRLQNQALVFVELQLECTEGEAKSKVPVCGIKLTMA